MGIIGTNAVVAKRGAFGEALTSVADSTAQNPRGAIVFHADSSSRWSVLRYYKAAATIAQGAVLVKDTGSRDPDQLITSVAADDGGRGVCKGIAAAAVSNTGYFSWAYVAGYCPDAAMPTAYASNQWMRISATYAGRLSSAALNATVAHENTSLDFAVAFSLGAATVSTANSTNSCILQGWFM